MFDRVTRHTYILGNLFCLRSEGQLKLVYEAVTLVKPRRDVVMRLEIDDGGFSLAHGICEGPMRLVRVTGNRLILCCTNCQLRMGFIDRIHTMKHLAQRIKMGHYDF